jgi:hypothetical protein
VEQRFDADALLQALRGRVTAMEQG